MYIVPSAIWIELSPPEEPLPPGEPLPAPDTDRLMRQQMESYRSGAVPIAAGGDAGKPREEP
jgi:hypothetical protein